MHMLGGETEEDDRLTPLLVYKTKKRKKEKKKKKKRKKREKKRKKEEKKPANGIYIYITIHVRQTPKTEQHCQNCTPAPSGESIDQKNKRQ